MIYIVIIGLIMWATYSLATQYEYSESRRAVVTAASAVLGIFVPIGMFIIKKLGGNK